MGDLPRMAKCVASTLGWCTFAKRIPHSSISSNKHDNLLVVVCSLQQDAVGRRRETRLRHSEGVSHDPCQQVPNNILEYHRVQRTPANVRATAAKLARHSVLQARSLPLEARCLAEGDKSLRYRSSRNTRRGCTWHRKIPRELFNRCSRHRCYKQRCCSMVFQIAPLVVSVFHVRAVCKIIP